MNHIYHQLILEHNRNPRNRGGLAEATHVAEMVNPTCGDRLRVAVQVDSAGRLLAVAFEGDSCAIATAAASLMTDVVRDLDIVVMQALGCEFRRFIESAEPLSSASLQALAPLGTVRDYPGRKRCATLPWEALSKALKERADV